MFSNLPASAQFIALLDQVFDTFEISIIADGKLKIAGAEVTNARNVARDSPLSILLKEYKHSAHFP